MPRFSRPIYDKDGRCIGLACGSTPYKKCSTPDCRNDATIQCDFPVTRAGCGGTCDRWRCRACAKNVGFDRDYCGVHARAAKEPAP